MLNVSVLNGTMEQNEIDQYMNYIEKENPNRILETLELSVDGEFVDMKYTFKPVKFDRIRRITGYLVGTMDRWNDAKTSEEHDRVKHTLEY
ncbi:MAG: anaerobic ribonucleoside-triphosphate reductase [Candidatus Metalachnospira sp.]|nr:anaerobic ribonucleoside-triphosphate reductase [Candidatus Metalachnospira sp.]